MALSADSGIEGLSPSPMESGLVMSKSRGRRSAMNEPVRRPLTQLSRSGDMVIFGCLECGELHIHHLSRELVEALEHENEERPHLSSATSHDHSLDLATESNSAHHI